MHLQFGTNCTNETICISSTLSLNKMKRLTTFVLVLVLCAMTDSMLFTYYRPRIQAVRDYFGFLTFYKPKNNPKPMYFDMYFKPEPPITPDPPNPSFSAARG